MVSFPTGAFQCYFWKGFYFHEFYLFTNSSQRLKKLRRRTWSAPNRNMSRLSLALPPRTESLSNLEGIREESMNFPTVTSENDVGNDSGETNQPCIYNLDIYT